MVALARSLLLSETLGYDALAQALLESATRRTSLVDALLATNAIDPERLDAALRSARDPAPGSIAPLTPFVALLPHGLCERLFAVPIAHDPATGTVDVACADVEDAHALEEIAFWLGAPVRAVATPLASLRAALDRIASETEGPSTRPGLFVRPREAPADAPAPAESAARAAAQARDELFDLLVATSRTIAPNVVLLVVERGALVAWACSPEVGSPEPLRRWRLPLATPSTLRATLERGEAASIRLPTDAAHSPLLDALGRDCDLFAAPVLVEGRRAALVVAGAPYETGTALARLAELARSAGDSLARLLRAYRR